MESMELENPTSPTIPDSMTNKLKTASQGYFVHRGKMHPLISKNCEITFKNQTEVY